ncbi:MAG TPA: DNA mismatch repair protein MutS [Vicinamibacterales bacterium]|jgi:DNA mismatch repair protein MutS|nr:DNA mismatch repair protein MutS [Vicinamibacterales bacterium]
MSAQIDSAASASASATPAMRQYFDAKRQHRDAIMFFRMGDFYEMFYEDALVAARALELTLTSRSKDASGGAIPMCGVPYHAADGYIARLVRQGFRVAVCEQVEDPRKAKGIVRREVIRVVSPGTLTDASYLDAREPAFIMSIAGPASPDGITGVALVDLSTGEFSAAEYAGRDGRVGLADDLTTLRPREVVVAAGVPGGPSSALPPLPNMPLPRLTEVEPWTFDVERARRTLLDQLRTQTLAGFGLEGHPAASAAAGALVQYLKDTQKVDLAHVRAIAFRAGGDALIVDPTTARHLEIVEGASGGRAGSLLEEVDRTITPGGGRLLRGWLLRPLVSLERVQERLDAVEELAFRSTDRGRLREAFKQVHDIERLVARAALGTAGPRDLVALRQSLAAVPRLRLLLAGLQAPLVVSLAGEMDDVAEVRDAIAATLVDEPPVLARDGSAIRDGVDPELDDLRGISRGGKQRIAEMEADERTRTGIGSLKIRYNRVFGYYIEVSKSNLGAVPSDYLRKQTIAGGERFITPALKEYEERVLGADERILEREIEMFDRLRGAVAAEAPRLQDTARAVAALDVLSALAETASGLNYTKPQMHRGDELTATDVRHAVVERHSAEPFVPNDVLLDADAHQLVILTGPNMGGKSTYLRQTALLSLLAQAGSFVPARSAKLPIVDRIFARVGASDNIARGQSTFMVEMQETANILHTATSRSLVILDEIGRGTATFDGLSLAWAVAEHLATNSRSRPKTIFATHYHELTDLADAVAGVANFHVVVREWKEDIVFLRKVVPGRSDRSYGIQVARLAGLPAPVIARAREILDALERDELARGGRPSLTAGTPPEGSGQLGLFQVPAEDHAVVRRLRQLDVDRMTPLEALTLLAELKKDAE